MERPRFLITDSAGFVGRHMIAEAVRNGYEVVVPDIKENNSAGMEFVRADIRDRAEVARGIMPPLTSSSILPSCQALPTKNIPVPSPAAPSLLSCCLRVPLRQVAAAGSCAILSPL